jgi:hypothetical protein
MSVPVKTLVSADVSTTVDWMAGMGYLQGICRLKDQVCLLDHATISADEHRHASGVVVDDVNVAAAVPRAVVETGH